MRSALNHSSWCAYRQPTRVLSPGAASRRPHAVVAARGLLSQELRAVAIRIRESTSWAMSSPFNAVIGRRMFAAPPRGEERSTAQSSTYPGRARIKRDFQSEQQLKNFDERKSSQFDGLQLLDYNKAMIACARSSDAERAMELFAEADTRFGCDSYSFQALAHALVRCGRIEEAMALLDEIRARTKEEPHPIVYDTVLHGAVTAGNMEAALRVMVQRREKNIDWMQMTLIASLRLAAKEGITPAVFTAWNESVAKLRASKTKIGWRPLAALAVALAKTGQPVQAGHVLRCLADACKTGSNLDALDDHLLDRAIDVPQIAQTTASTARLNAPVAQDLQVAHIQGESEARADAQTLRKVSTQRDGFLLQWAAEATLAAFSRAGDAKGARESFEWIKAEPPRGEGVEETEAMYRALIRGLVDEKSGDEQRQRPDLLNTGGWGASAAKAEVVEKVERELRMRMTGDKGRRDTNLGVETFNKLLHEAARIGGPEAAFLVWQRLENQGWRPDLVSYNTLLTSHARIQNPRGAWAVYDEMRHVGVPPDEVTWVSLLNAHSRPKNGTADPRVYDAVREMEVAGMRPTEKTATALIRVLGHLGEAREARRVLDDFRTRGGHCTQWMYDALMDAQANSLESDGGGLPNAVATLREMSLLGLDTTRNALNIVIAACRRRDHQVVDGELRSGSFFLAFALSVPGCQPRPDGFNNLLKIAMEHSGIEGSITEALLVLRDMVAYGVPANENTFKTILLTAQGSLTTVRQEQRLLHACLDAGARPRESLVESLIQQSLHEERPRDAVWMLGMALQFHLLSPHRVLHAQKDCLAALSNADNEKRALRGRGEYADEGYWESQGLEDIKWDDHEQRGGGEVGYSARQSMSRQEKLADVLERIRLDALTLIANKRSAQRGIRRHPKKVNTPDVNRPTT